MKTMFKSQEVWDLVEKGFEDTNPAVPDQQLRDNRKKDAKALFWIQSALEEDILSRIMAVTTSHEAWNILKQEYLGDQKVIKVKLQTLRHNFEMLSMKNQEGVQEYLARVSNIVSQMKTYGENVSNETVVSKVLRSLTPQFEYVVPAIMESHDLSTYSFDEMMSSLLSHEDRLNRKVEKTEEKAFQVKGGCLRQNSQNSFGTVRGRGRSRGRGSFDRNTGRGVADKSNIMCHYCKKYGHFQADCWKKQNSEKRVSYAEQEAEQPRLFMAYKSVDTSRNVWYLDSGCSNHMTSFKSFFKEIDESHKLKVKLGNDKELQVEGRGNVAVQDSAGKQKLIYDVYYIPELAQNLLSIGQIVGNNCSVFFDDNGCVVKDKKTGFAVACAQKTSNNMYPLELFSVDTSALVAKVLKATKTVEEPVVETEEVFNTATELAHVTTTEQKSEVSIVETEVVVQDEEHKLLRKGEWCDRKGEENNIYTENISPTKAVLNKIPYEGMCGQKLFNAVKWSTYDNSVFVSVIIEENAEQGGTYTAEDIVGVTHTTPDLVSDSKNQTTVEEGSSSSRPGQKFRSLQDIYEQSQVLYCVDPVCFEQAVEQEDDTKKGDVMQDREAVTVCQSGHRTKKLEEKGMTECNNYSLLMEPSCKLNKDDEEPPEDVIVYENIIGCLRGCVYKKQVCTRCVYNTRRVQNCEVKEYTKSETQSAVQHRMCWKTEIR